MPRPPNLNKLVLDVLSKVTPQIVAVVKAQLERQSPAPKGKALKRAVAKPKQHHTTPAHCLYPGCKEPHKGPRFSFLCAKHRGASKAKRAKYLADWKAKK